MDFIFDNQDDIGDKVREWYPVFKQHSGPGISALLGKTPLFGDEMVEIPLQAADLFAWYQRRNALESMHGEWHRGVWKKISEYHSSGTIDMEDLISIGKTLGFLPL